MIVLEQEQLSDDEYFDICKKICYTYLRSDMDKLITYANKGLQRAKDKNKKIFISQFYQYLGNGYYTKGDYNIALEYFNKALDLAIEEKNKRLEGTIYGSIANVYTFQSQELTALEYSLKALSVFESIGDKKYCAIALGNISSIHEMLQNEQQAFLYLQQAEKIAEELDDDYIKTMVYRKLAIICSKNNEFDEAIQYNLKTLEYSRSIGDKQGEILSLEALSSDYIEGKNDYDTAEKYALECFDVAKDFDDPRLYIASQKILSTVYLKQKRFEDCKNISLQVWETDSLIMKDFKAEADDLLSNLIQSYIYLGDKDKASYFFDTYKQIVAGNIDKNFQESIADMQTKYETEKKEMRIDSLEKEKQLYIWLGIGGILLALALIIVLWQNRRNMQKEKQLIATRSVMDGEMQERTRLARDLHDRLSGNLSAVKIELGNVEAILNVGKKLDACIEEVRRVAHNLMPASLQQGIKVALEDFAAQFPNVNFHFFGEEKKLDDTIAFVVYCCASELVGNSLKHSGAKHVNLQFIQEDKYLSLTVQDDGHGYDEKTVIKGMGLKNIHDRVASCNGTMDIVSSPDKGTETTIQIKI